ncbi:YeeE/YedE family protein [Rhodovulum sp. DZ06]|uniref:YeeE/YedE family protein n=1 Tax=Rhodovulum sp. DZ06 TaxID=3425126 RepID=UPI003D32516D
MTISAPSPPADPAPPVSSPAAAPSSAPAPPPGAAPRPQRGPVLAAAALLAALAALAGEAQGATGFHAAGLGALAGVALYHARFGFTAGWRAMTRERRGAGLRAQMLLIGLIACASFPLMEWGAAAGVPARGHILPMGLASALGAAMFGLGMQLGGGCASGTLYTAGGGSARMGVTLVFFVAGSVIATAHWDFWAALPRTRAGVSLRAELGALGGLAALLAGLGAVAAWSWAAERRAHGRAEGLGALTAGSGLRGPWSLLAGALALALVGAGCFALLGRPWGVTAGFALWGAKAAQGLGFAPEGWSYWSGWRAEQLSAPIWRDATSVMNLGIMLGALAASGAAGRFSPRLRLGLRDVLTAAAGGLLMGYGARLAYGCNIGAYLGGLTSGSLHGAWWMVFGAAGSWAGVKARARLGMD